MILITDHSTTYLEDNSEYRKHRNSSKHTVGMPNIGHPYQVDGNHTINRREANLDRKGLWENLQM